MSNGWPSVPLREVATPVQRAVAVVPGKSYRTLGVKWWGEGAYERDTIDGSQTAATTLNEVREGDLIINKIWVRHGSVAIVGPQVHGCAGSNEFPTFELDPQQILPLWVHWFTKTRDLWQKCDALSQGTSGKNRIRPERFLSIDIPLPPLPEQQRIVAKIEELTAKAEEARRLKAVTLDQSLNFWKVLSRMARDNAFPKSRLTDMVDFLDGQRVPLSKSEREKRRGQYPYYGASGIIDYLDDYLFDEELLLLSEDGANLINRSTPIAFVARGQYWVNNHAHVLRPRTDAVDIRFLEYALSDYDVSEFNFASAQAKLNQRNAMKISFGLPPLPEQRRVVAYLDDLQVKAEALKALQSQSAVELDALLPSVLDKAFKGEL